MTIPTLTLNDGREIPQLGFGVFQVDPAETERVVSDALEVGYRHIDTAAAYRNESGVGAAIAKSGIPRDELWITTKLFNNDHPNDKAHAAMDRSLDALGLDYVDLYITHWPTLRGDYVEAYLALEEMKAAGQTRSIGVSNHKIDQLEAIIAEAHSVPAVNQIELHPAFAQAEQRAFGAEHGIVIESWSPLGGGKYAAAEEAPVAAAAEAHGVSGVQVLLRWHLQSGLVVIPKSNNRERMAQNFDVFGFELSPDEMATIDALDRGMRIGGDPDVVN